MLKLPFFGLAGSGAGDPRGEGFVPGALTRLSHLPRDGRDTLFLLAVLAWTVLPQTPNLPWWCIGITTAVLLWRAQLAVAGAALPSKRWLLALLVVCAGLTWMTHRTLLGRDAGVTLVVVLLALKTLELRAKRDAFVVFFLGFFTMLTNFLYSQSLLTAACMLIAVLGLLTALVNAHMQVGRPSLWASARIALGMAGLGAPIMLVLFMLFPRLAPLWGIPGDGMSGRTGLSNTMQVGTMAKLALDESVALRVQWLKPDGSPESRAPLPMDLYFRGPVLSSFDGREWRPLRSGFTGQAPLLANLQVSGAGVRYRVTQEPNNRPWLFVLEATPTRPDLPGHELQQTADLQWLSTRPLTDIMRFEATSYPNFRHGPLRNTLLLQDFLDLPPGFNPRTLALAAELRRDPRYAQAGAAELVPAVLERLASQGYSYTLEPGVYGRHTADEFWFDRKEGFCEHIASAFVILMRGLDIPARVVTGYQGGDFNNLDQFWTVRQSDAHAWAEVWQAGRGWVRVDPTAAVAPNRVAALRRLAPPVGVIGGAFAALSPGLMLNVRAIWEAVNNAWNQRVLNYTQSKQLDLLKGLGFNNPSWEDIAYVLIGLLVSVSLVGAAWTYWERFEHDPWLRLAARARARLAGLGLSSSGATPPRDLALRAKALWGDEADSLAAWLLEFERARYSRSANVKTTKADVKALQADFGLIRWPDKRA